MAYTDDGSRVCDSARVALAAINVDVALQNNVIPVIYCAAIKGTTGDRMRVLDAGQFTLHWRRAGGAFAPITNATEVKIAATGTALVNGTGVTNVNARCNKTATFIDGGGIETEGAASSTTTPINELRDINSGEWQIALDFSGALGSQVYNFRGVVLHDAGTTNIDFLTDITSAVIGAIFSDDFSSGVDPNTTNWTEEVGSWAVSGGTLNDSGSGATFNYVTTKAAAHAAIANVRAQVLNSSSNVDGGPLVRFTGSGASSTCYYLDPVQGLTTANLYRRVNAVDTLVLAVTLGSAAASGQSFGLEAVGVGATVTLRVYQNGVQQGSDILDTNAARLVAVGKTGIISWNGSGVWDNFLVIDMDFGAAPPPPEPQIVYLKQTAISQRFEC